jgi:hypothetical protein
METVCNRLSSYLPCYATAYGNGVSPPKISRTAAQAIQALSCLISVSSGGDKRPRTVAGKAFRAIDPSQNFRLIDKIIS